MKKQTGMWVDSLVWEHYRKLCSDDKLRPTEPVEEFLKLVVRSGSPRAVVDLLKGMEKSKVEGFEAYARVLLHWYTHDKFWMYTVGMQEVAVERLLLEALKNVEDERLRSRIEEALVSRAPANKKQPYK